jgi:methylenetetrahydrofolate dehydrogenase (NADP+)/methenyltetrahydrofolate cyclohydrolase
MMTEIKEYVEARKAELRDEMASLKRPPSLAIISVGDDPASATYIRGKLKDAAEVGFKAENIRLPEDTKEEDLLALLRKLNDDDSVDGVLVQLPVPKQIRTEAINRTIDPSKDVDGFVPGTKFTPCTAKGIVDYLDHEGYSFRGKNAVVIGRSQIVGRPTARLLLNKDCNVTVLHSKTSGEDMRFYLKHADLIVVAVGHLGFIDESYELKESAYVIDVGINRGEDGHVHGDCVPGLKVAYQNPVPRGVGLLTRLALLDNLLEAAKR